MVTGFKFQISSFRLFLQIYKKNEALLHFVFYFHFFYFTHLTLKPYTLPLLSSGLLIVLVKDKK